MPEEKLVNADRAHATAHPAPSSRPGAMRERLAVPVGLEYDIPRVADRLPYFLGSLTLFGIIIQVVTGIYLTQFYNPSPAAAHQSIQYIILRAPLGDFVRSVHLWSGDLILITVTLTTQRSSNDLQCPTCPSSSTR